VKIVARALFTVLTHITRQTSLTAFPFLDLRFNATLPQTIHYKAAAVCGVMSNRMKQILILFIFVISTQSNADESPFYVGTWQSNEEKTLASMNEVHDIPEKTKLFLRDNFFGRLVNVVREDTFAAYFIGERPDKLVFRPYDVEVLSNSTIRITYYDEFTDSNVIQTLTFEENCYSLQVSKWNFKEYFCREN